MAIKRANDEVIMTVTGSKNPLPLSASLSDSASAAAAKFTKAIRRPMRKKEYWRVVCFICNSKFIFKSLKKHRKITKLINLSNR